MTHRQDGATSLCTQLPEYNPAQVDELKMTLVCEPHPQYLSPQLQKLTAVPTPLHSPGHQYPRVYSDVNSLHAHSSLKHMSWHTYDFTYMCSPMYTSLTPTVVESQFFQGDPLQFPKLFHRSHKGRLGSLFTSTL